MSPQPRKRPHCLTCGLPMAGHKRQQCFPGSPVTPPSPPASPHRPRSTPGQHDTSNLPTGIVPHEASFVIPQHGAWHRRNPRWVDPPPPRMPSPTGSLVPTILVDDDGNTVASSVGNDDDGENSEVESKSTTSAQVTDILYELSKPIVTIFSIKSEDIPKIRDAAATVGLHTGVVHTPRKVAASTKQQPPSQHKSKRGIQREHSWWLVVGRKAGVVTQVVDSQQREMPGTIGEVSEMMEGPRITTFPQLILASVIGGAVVVYGLSLL